MGTRHKSEAERRIQIIEAARKVFLRKGYYDTRMDDIVKESRLSKGALYWYFKGKRDVFNAIYTMWFDEMMKMLDLVLLSDKRVEEKIYEVGLLTVSFLKDDPKSFRAMLELYIQAMDDKRSWKLLGEFYKKLIAVIAKALREGIKEGGLRPDLDVNSTALFITYNLDMLGLIPLLGIEVDLKKHWEQAFGIIIEGISKKKKGKTSRRKK